MTLARGYVLNRALIHARQGKNFQIAPQTLRIACRLRWRGVFSALCARFPLQRETAGNTQPFPQ